MRTTIAVFACLFQFAAHAYQYTLAARNGMPTCNFVDLTLKNELAYGTLHSERCTPPAPTLAGSGVSTKIRGSSDRLWSFTVTGADATSLYLLDLKSLTWVQYYENSGNPLQLAGSGVLLMGNQKPSASIVAH